MRFQFSGSFNNPIRFFKCKGKCFALVACLILSLSHSFSYAEVSYDTIALTGTDGSLGPNMGPGIQFDRLNSYWPSAINNNDDVIIRSRIIGSEVDSTNEDGIWLASGGSISLIARTGVENLPGPNLGTGNTFISFRESRLNNHGEVSFWAHIDGEANGSGLWLNQGTTNDPVAQYGFDDTLGPGLGSGVYVSPDTAHHSHDDTGNIIFPGEIRGSGYDSSNFQGMWLNDGATNTPRVLTGVDNQFGPGMGPGFLFTSDPFEGTFSDFFNGPTGTFYFPLAVAGPGIDNTNHIGIWKHDDHGNTVLARTGQTDATGPGLGSSTPFISIDGFGSVATNQNGLVAFSGLIDSQAGIWVHRDGENAPLTLTDDTGVYGPGLQESYHFDWVGRISIDNDGSIAFIGRLDNSSDTDGIWINHGGANIPILLEGRDDQFGPGMGSGLEFRVIKHFEFGPGGDLVVNANLDHDADVIDGSNNEGVWAYVDNQLHLIAREGDMFDINPDPLINDLRTIGSDLSFTTPNDHGNFVLNLNFTDGSRGVFLVNIPEPNTFAILCVVVTTLFQYRNRSQI